jgi:poly(A) polymerase
LTFPQGAWDHLVMLRERAVEIVRTLVDAGHQAVFAGGCVRDRLLGIEPVDYDVATSARPEEIERLFARTIPVGRQFGIIVVPVDGYNVEVATFRVDGPYLDGRHPSRVEFTDARTDAQRRDFTINAMFEDPVAGEVLDYVGGRQDLEAGVIRAVGDPDQRFAEDRLRMIRAARFAARFGFRIHEPTLTAMRRAAPHVGEVSAERINEELTKLLTEGHARRGFELLEQTGLLAHVLPELIPMKGCAQTPDFHPEGDVWTHTLCCLENLPAGCSRTLAWGVLLHDVAKPATASVRPDGRPTFYGHTHVGAEMAAGICRRLRMSNAQTERIAFLVDQHLRHCSATEMRRSTLKRFLRQDGIEELLELTRIDALGSNGDLSKYEYARAQLTRLLAAGDELRPQPLIDGHDLIGLGLERGPLFREILSAVEEAQLDGRLASRDDALAWVRERYSPGRLS